ncbi:MAG TPA: protein kinase [Terracidiphilus sp.]|nr:protein kinase [Terracidiphilus sp.]
MFTWIQVRDVIDGALELPVDKRDEFLGRACPEPSLRRYVDSLIRSYDQAGGFLESAPQLSKDLWSGVPVEEPWVGRRLGAYEITEEIGEGGMGSVFRAVRADDEYRKQVAIKVVKRGFETAFAVSRFRAERQILANLEHPNIARLIDGGATPEGLPYFVMELVEGQSIDRYCDTHRLPIRDRLRLFLSVCSAVAYAHGKLVVHRDLKPANILITGDGTPKLLDFGIAKILTQDPDGNGNELSVAVLRILTPEFASPEQIAGAAAGTSTDVYSLGVVLYLLLTGRRPYEIDSRQLDQLAGIVSRAEPARLSTSLTRGQVPGKPAGTGVDVTATSIAAARSTNLPKLRRQLAGDLDNIVLMALRKEPERRYASVEQLSEDIRRHLEGLPVIARKETLRYRASKFVSRNRIPVAAAVLLVLSLATGLVVSLYEARVAREQRARADRRFQDVRELANSLMFELHDAIADLPGSTPARKLLLDRALRYQDSLAKEARGDRSLELELATAYDKIGDVQGQPLEANLGDPAAAIRSYEKALALRESAAAENPRDARTLTDLVTSYIRLSDLLSQQGDDARALEMARKEVPAAENLSRLDPANERNRRIVALCQIDQGYKEARFGGDRTLGRKTLESGAAAFEAMLANRPGDPSMRQLAVAYGRLAELESQEPGQNADALASFRKAIAALQPEMNKDPQNAPLRRMAAYYQHAMAERLDFLKRPDEALAQEREALATLQPLAKADPVNAQLRQDIAAVRGHIGAIQIEGGQVESGVVEVRESLSALSGLPGARDPKTIPGYTTIEDQFWLGKAFTAKASAKGLPAARKAEFCRDAESALRLSQPGFEELCRNGPSAECNGRADEIRGELSKCSAPAALRNPSSDAGTARLP